MILLGVDYGLKRIGLAISSGYLAEPVKVINNSKDLVVKIIKICDQNRVSRIVIGLPGKSKMAQTIRHFGQNFKKASRLPVVYWDETLTSVEAQKLSTDKKKIDAIAAALMLQSYLDEVVNDDYKTQK